MYVPVPFNLISHGFLEIVLSWRGVGGWGRQKVFAAHNPKSIQVILRNFGTVINNHKAVQMVHFNCHILRLWGRKDGGRVF